MSFPLHIHNRILPKNGAAPPSTTIIRRPASLKVRLWVSLTPIPTLMAGSLCSVATFMGYVTFYRTPCEDRLGWLGWLADLSR